MAKPPAKAKIIFEYKPVVLDTENSTELRHGLAEWMAKAQVKLNSVVFDYEPVMLDSEKFKEMAREEFKEFHTTIIAEGKAEAMVIKAAAKVIQASDTINAKAEVIEELPAASSFILACLASKGRAEEFLGDAETEYRKIVPRLGAARARWWYRVYVAQIAIRLLPSVSMRVLLLHKLIGLLGL